MDASWNIFLVIYCLLFCRIHVNGWQISVDQLGITNITDLDIPAGEKYVIIRYSAIDSLPSGGFSHLTRCKELYLDANNIENVNREALFGLMELNVLDLL